MRKWILACIFCTGFLQTDAYVYLGLDNHAAVGNEEVLKDPFLIIRSKPYSTYLTSEVLESTSNTQVWIANGEEAFVYETPYFYIKTDAETPEKVYWQISSNPHFKGIIPNFEELGDYTGVVTLSPLTDTFFNAEEEYFFHAKVRTEEGWSDWSEPYPFVVFKPKPVREIALEDGKLCWKGEDGCNYMIFSGKDPHFIPEIYTNEVANLAEVTKKTEVEIDRETPFYRIVAEKDGQYSVPSELINLDDPPLPKGYTKPAHIDQEVWDKVSPFFLPVDHPIKAKLDQIFRASRATVGIKSMVKAGFSKPKPRKFTHIVVATHQDIPNYIFKLYLDAQRYHKKKPEWHYWLLRVEGAELLRAMINENGWNGQWKVPKKYIYPLPENPKPPKYFIRKDFILVEEDMEILDDKSNRAKWGSDVVDKGLLDQLCYLVTEIGLHDGPKPDNVPWCKDGRVAFVDTQSIYYWPVLYWKMFDHLKPDMKAYWKQITKNQRKK